MGTGTFTDTNTGDSVHASVAGYIHVYSLALHQHDHHLSRHSG